MRSENSERKSLRDVSVVFDNSALTNLLNCEQNILALCARLDSGNFRIIIPFDAITEATSGTNQDAIFGRLSKLAPLVRTYPLQVILARDSAVWLRYEWRNGGVQNNIPHLHASARFKGIMKMLDDRSEFDRIHGGLGATRIEIFDRREALRKADKQFRERCLRDLPRGEPLTLLEDLKFPVPLSALGPIPMAFEFLPGFTKARFRRAIRSTGRFRMLQTYVALTYIRALANAVEPSTVPEHLREVIKIVSGNWFDLGLIAAAANQDFIVTDDVGQAAVNRFARERGFVKCEPISLSALLDTFKIC